MHNRKTYVVAVSGGVDSVVLLHKIVKHNSMIQSLPADRRDQSSKNHYIVAHFDHGIRPDSASDAQFVADLAAAYGLECVVRRADLGTGVSEATARTARYAFLRSILQESGGEAIITAHNQDDVIETMIAHLLRGTGPRGLIGFTATDILRPLIEVPKKDLVSYAQQHKLTWREDSTNIDQNYLRNYIRIQLIPRLLPEHRDLLLGIREKLQSYYREIDDFTQKLLAASTTNGEIRRSIYVTFPYAVQKELIATLFRLNNIEFDKKLIEYAVVGSKILQPHKHIEITKNAKLYAKRSTVLLKIRDDSV